MFENYFCLQIQVISTVGVILGDGGHCFTLLLLACYFKEFLLPSAFALSPCSSAILTQLLAEPHHE